VSLLPLWAKTRQQEHHLPDDERITQQYRRPIEWTSPHPWFEHQETDIRVGYQGRNCIGRSETQLSNSVKSEVAFGLKTSSLPPEEIEERARWAPDIVRLGG
jgi:hypothetical protein